MGKQPINKIFRDLVQNKQFHKKKKFLILKKFNLMLQVFIILLIMDLIQKFMRKLTVL